MQSPVSCWGNDDVRTATPRLCWRLAKRQALICSERKAYVAVHPETGETDWKIAGGGDSTVISGDWMVVYSKDKKVGLAAYRRPRAGPSRFGISRCRSGARSRPR